MNADQTDKPTTSTSHDDLVSLLTSQRDLYVQLGRLAAGQRAWITRNEPEQLLAVLGHRQQLIDQLEAVSRQLRPYQASWRQIREGLPPAEGRRIDQLIAEVNALLSGILEQDEADARMLSARKSQTGQAIGTLKTGRQAEAAYAASAYSPGPQVDWSER